MDIVLFSKRMADVIDRASISVAIRNSNSTSKAIKAVIYQIARFYPLVPVFSIGESESLLATVRAERDLPISERGDYAFSGEGWPRYLLKHPLQRTFWTR